MKVLIKNGFKKIVSDRTVELLSGNMDGWEVYRDLRTVFQNKKEDNVVYKDNPTRNEMIKYLKEKGIKIHPRTGDNKLKARYYDEINID